MLDIIWQLLIGLVIGALARLLLPGREAISDGALGWLITALIGMAGAFIGTIVGRTLWGGQAYAAGWIMSILGAILLLVLYRVLFNRRSAAVE